MNYSLLTRDVMAIMSLLKRGVMGITRWSFLYV